jgi:3-oxoacyl-[acyl-carrier-protein] synthase II
MRITASSTIAYQPTFRNPGFSQVLSVLQEPSVLVVPDYNEFIPAMDRRRMSEVLKMSIACTLDCLEQAGIQQPDAIIVGTSMGCCIHTRNFLDKIQSADGGLISPTSFILSTHNTIAGQISLHLKNHGYNITHTQNSLSFEQAMIDAMMGIREGWNHALVGGADELEASLFNMNARLGLETIHNACGSSYFMLSSGETDKAFINVLDVGSYGLVTNRSETILDFLKVNDRSTADIDLIVYSHSSQDTVDELIRLFGQHRLVDIQVLCGTWLTNSAFAMAYAVDVLSLEKCPLVEGSIRTVLICNSLIPENLGLLLLNINNVYHEMLG